MKKNIIASILTAALLAASIAPVYGAEFISDPEEVVFSAGDTVAVTAQQKPRLVKMEWVEKPKTPLYSGLGLDNDGFISGYINDGKVRLHYSDGTSEIKRPCECLTNEILCGDTVKPAAGTYKANFWFYENPDMKLTADIVIKDSSTMPTIKGKGSQTVPFTLPYTQHVRFVTGSGQEYKITCSRKDEIANYIVDDEYGTFTAIADANGIVKNLKPNTAYYIIGKFFPGPMEDIPETITYTVSPVTKFLAKCTFKYSTAVAYTGKALKPTVRIYDGSKLLKKNTDYTIVSCVNNVKIGTATITIKGKGSYTGTVKKTFRILPKKVAISSAKRTGNTSAKLTWGSVKGAYGYVVYRATGNTWTRVGATRSTSFTDKTIDEGITYKYKIRVYAKVNGKNVYGYYSPVKTVK